MASPRGPRLWRSTTDWSGALVSLHLYRGVGLALGHDGRMATPAGTGDGRDMRHGCLGGADAPG
jgi:hypothetical protein